VEPYDGEDIYCDLIIPGKLPVTVVAETEAVLAFHHTRPHWPVHLVVVPKAHIPSLLKADPTTTSRLLDIVKDVAAGIVADTGSCRVMTNLGSYQDSKHLHFHVCSRAARDVEAQRPAALRERAATRS
jgi:histidine triad (HIT) family protein